MTSSRKAKFLRAVLRMMNEQDLGRELGVSGSLVSHWKAGRKPLPEKHLARLEEIVEERVARAVRIIRLAENDELDFVDDAEVEDLLPLLGDL